MKRVSILVNMENLQIFDFSYTSLKYLYNYIDYKLSPFQKLGLFKYNRYSSDYISGEKTPEKIKKIIFNHISTDTSVNFSDKSLINFDLFILDKQQFYLTEEEYNSVIKNIQKYCIFFTDLYI